MEDLVEGKPACSQQSSTAQKIKEQLFLLWLRVCLHANVFAQNQPLLTELYIKKKMSPIFDPNLYGALYF